MTNTDQLREAVRRFCRSEQAADNLVAFIEQYKANAVRAAELQGHRTTSTVLQYVIEAHSGFMGNSKAAARHWKKQTDKLIEDALNKEGSDE